MVYRMDLDGIFGASYGISWAGPGKERTGQDMEYSGEQRYPAFFASSNRNTMGHVTVSDMGIGNGRKMGHTDQVQENGTLG